ncbi:hypothetical protein MN608_03683 [Microdochium nivale]|nr:hypothetical protein MN608_03683 [Microdochium nivale]
MVFDISSSVPECGWAAAGVSGQYAVFALWLQGPSPMNHVRSINPIRLFFASSIGCIIRHGTACTMLDLDNRDAHNVPSRAGAVRRAVRDATPMTPSGEVWDHLDRTWACMHLR